MASAVCRAGTSVVSAIAASRGRRASTPGETAAPVSGPAAERISALTPSTELTPSSSAVTVNVAICAWSNRRHGPPSSPVKIGPIPARSR